MTEFTDDLEKVMINLADTFDKDLLEKTQAQLEENWFFKYDPDEDITENLYQFHDLLELYGSWCRRWEQAKNGPVCIVERVRDKYLLPKIREFVAELPVNKLLIDFIKEVAKPPYPDTDDASLLETFRARARVLLETIEKDKK